MNSPVEILDNDDNDGLSYESDKPIFSFSFTGCNRIGRIAQSSDNPSTANKFAMQRIFKELTDEEYQPELFFFLGDLVLAETNTTNLKTQLGAWNEIYKE